MGGVCAAFLEAAEVMNDMKELAIAFLKDVQPGTKEQAAFEDFLRHVGVKVRNEFRDAWLAKVNAGVKQDAVYRVLPEDTQDGEI